MSIKKQELVAKGAMEISSKAQSSFVNSKKKEALEMFKAMPMPKESEDDWRYAKIEKLELGKFLSFEPKTRIFAALSEDLAEEGIILTDINTALGNYPEAQKHYFKNIKADNDKFIALNAAYFTNGIFLYVPENVEFEEPIRINFDFDGKASILHNLVIAGSNSKINLVEEYNNKGANQEQLNCCITEVFAGSNSKINFHHINSWTKDVCNFTNIIGALEKGASISWFSGCFGGRINRLKIDTNLYGESSQSSSIGVFFGKEKEHIDFTANAYHNAKGTTSSILVHGALRDEAASICRGLIKIEKKAQKSNSYLANRILKLGEKTMASSIPSLKIDANDVKAGHGTAIGQIDEEQIFYLMAKGLPRNDAEKLIAEGFFEPAVRKIHEEEFGNKIRKLVRQ